jgi:hypothetical protein
MFTILREHVIKWYVSTFVLKSKYSELGLLAHTCNPSTWKAEAGGSQVPGQTETDSKTSKKPLHTGCSSVVEEHLPNM